MVAAGFCDDVAMTVTHRPRRAFWGDVRFLIGIALVALSITGVWLVVSSTDQATPVLQATRTITEGEILTSDDVRVVEVGLGSAVADYVGPQDMGAGHAATRTIAEGELVPDSALRDPRSARSTTLVIDSATGIPEDVEPGTVIEIWHAPPSTEEGSFDSPRVLISDAVVRAVVETDGILADGGSELEVVIDRADVAAVLSAISSGSSLSVVPIGAGS